MLLVFRGVTSPQKNKASKTKKGFKRWPSKKENDESFIGNPRPNPPKRR